jgi:hypothetical protein
MLLLVSDPHTGVELHELTVWITIRQAELPGVTTKRETS